jgi:hypothetical protein
MPHPSCANLDSYENVDLIYEHRSRDLFCNPVLTHEPGTHWSLFGSSGVSTGVGEVAAIRPIRGDDMKLSDVMIAGLVVAVVGWAVGDNAWLDASAAAQPVVSQQFEGVQAGCGACAGKAAPMVGVSPKSVSALPAFAPNAGWTSFVQSLPR